MRAQSGTTSLRAILYMDEIAGYFPPVATPPAKAPLLTLLKQGRAFGLGVVLATQNPVDLDYKGLANTGTWFLGRLQTERDKARVLEGLEGVAAGASQKFDRGRMEQLLAGPRQPRLPPEQRARGRAGGLRDALGAVVPARPADAGADQDADGPAARGAGEGARPRRRRPPPRRAARGGRRAAGPAARHPAALRAAAGLGRGRRLSRRGPRSGRGALRGRRRAASRRPRRSRGWPPVADPLDWAGGRAARVRRRGVRGGARRRRRASRRSRRRRASPKSYEAWSKDFATWIYRERTLELFKSPSTGAALEARARARRTSARASARAAARRATRRPRSCARSTRRSSPRSRSGCAARSRRSAREKQEATQAGLQTAISVGATVLGALFGRKTHLGHDDRQGHDGGPRRRADGQAGGRRRPRGGDGRRDRAADPGPRRRAAGRARRRAAASAIRRRRSSRR